MKRVAVVLMIAMVLLPGVALAGSSTDAALGLGAFAVLNQILSGTGVFGAFGRPVGAPQPVIVQQPVVIEQPVVVAPPAPVYYVAPPAPVYYVAPPAPVYYAAPPAPVYAPPAVVYAPAQPVYVAPAPVVVAPQPLYVAPRVIVRSGPAWGHHQYFVRTRHDERHWH